MRKLDDVSEHEAAALGEEWMARVLCARERRRMIQRATKIVQASSAFVEAKGERDMLLAVAFAHSRDREIVFKEDVHGYFLDGQRLPLSVSGFYMRHFVGFDAPGKVESSIETWRLKQRNKYYPLLKAVDAYRVPGDAQRRVILAGWELNGDTQSSLGTAMHRAIELTLNNECIPDAERVGDENSGEHECPLSQIIADTFNLSGRRLSALAKATREAARTGTFDFSFERGTEPVRTDTPEFALFLDWLNENDHLVPVRTEWSIWARDLQLGGQIDAVFLDSLTGQLVMVDWKRSKSMDIEPKCFPDTKPDELYGKPPFENVPNTNFGHYQVQQNCYSMILLRYYGVVISKMFLLRCHPSLKKAEMYEVPDLSAEVKAMFEARRVELREGTV